MEAIDIELNDLEPISINFDRNESRPSVNFGAGIELLMNDKIKSSSSSTNFDLGELDSLEAELNELSGNGGSNNDSKSISGMTSNFFGFNSSTNPETKNVHMSMNESYNDSKVGHATVESIGSTKTWDGFSKTNEVPAQKSNFSRINDREKNRKKRAMIKKLEEWKDKGFIKNMSHFTLDSDYDEIEDEYETTLEYKRNRDSVKLYGQWFMTFVNSVEWLNTACNPFDLNLDGWGEQIYDDIENYDEIFSELHEKYKGGKLAPEIALILKFGFSAACVNFTNKALATATPGFNDVIRQSPDLMRLFSNATVESMKQNSPAFSFAENILNPNMGPPPTPIKTRDEPAPPASSRPGMQYTQSPGNRPDLNVGRGGSEPMDRQERSLRNPQPRQEMQGPRNTDVDNILSGLKTKTINIHEQAQRNQYMEDDSLISISSLRDMKNTNMPRKANRRNRSGSEKNTISLDI